MNVIPGGPFWIRWERDAVGEDVAADDIGIRYLVHVYQSRGYLTPIESNYANQIGQTLIMLQSEKMKVDQALADEMLKHLVKMK